jgi:hypothetical protein
LLYGSPKFDGSNSQGRAHPAGPDPNRRDWRASNRVGGKMTDRLQRICDMHAEWLRAWRNQLEQLEAGEATLYLKRSNDSELVDITRERIAALRTQIEMVEQVSR